MFADRLRRERERYRSLEAIAPVGDRVIEELRYDVRAGRWRVMRVRVVVRRK